MTLDWQAEEPYVEVGGRAALEAMVRTVLAQVPREHIRHLEAVVALDHDPRGRNLGLYVRDHNGTRIELYLTPHVRDAQRAPARLVGDVLLLHVAHTIFHEIGHHMTLTLNRRRAPSKGRAAVSETLEKWAEEYVERRMEKFCAAIEAGRDDAQKAAFALARQLLQPAAG